MATYINNPSGNASDGSATGVIVGVLLVVLLAILLLVFGIPYLRDRSTPAPSAGGASLNIQLPTNNGDTSGTGNTTGQ